MVMKLIKGIFSRQTAIPKGKLFKGKSLILDNSSLQIIDDILVFNNLPEPKKFTISKISDITQAESALTFYYEAAKYKFVCDDPKFINQTYLSLYPLSSKPNSIYSNDSITYKIYNTEESKFIDVSGKVSVKIIVENDLFLLRIESQDDIIHFEEITTETQYYMDNKNSTFVWSVFKDGLWYTFCMVFENNIGYLEFLTKYVHCTYKLTDPNRVENKDYYEKMEKENVDGSILGNQEVFVQDIVKEDTGKTHSNEDEDYESFSEEDESVSMRFGDKEDKNELLVLEDDMAFVTRGSSIGVFSNKNGGLQFRENLHKVLPDSAKKILPFQKNSSLIALDKQSKDKLHKIDLERCDIVETWDFDRDINDYFNSMKISDNNTLVGLSDYSVFRIDPRTKEKITQSKDYKTKNVFQCGASTSRGDVAVASKTGDLRLYNKIDKRAKTLLPGFGDEIKHVDVTANGKYIVCTCKNYLMLYTVKDDYSKPLGKDKPVPKRLQLRPEHLAYIRDEVDFTPARFNTDEKETSIITGTGRYVVKWNLNDVLKGNLYAYQMTRCNDFVVADNFGFDNNNIIVALPDDVRDIDASVLKRPSRRTFE